jgi:adenylate cyclase
VLELQDEITTVIAGAIEPELLKSERYRIARQPEQREDAYEFYQRGLWHFWHFRKEDNDEAQAYFRRALAIDPQYAQPTAILAISILNAAFLGWTEDSERNYGEASSLAERAISLDPRYAMGHFALGAVCMWTGRCDHAITEFQEAISLNPSYAAAHVLLGQVYVYLGRHEEAIRLVEKGVRLSPKDPRLFQWLPALAGAHYQLGNYVEALEAGQRSWILNRKWPAGLRYVVASLAKLGRLDEARAALGELRLLNPEPAFVENNLRRLYKAPAAVDLILAGLRTAGFR